MSKRICFAGFSESEVDSFKSAVGSTVSVWDCAFVADGTETIAELSSERYDAVVANLQMEGLRGDEVLQQAVKLQPDALRFIVGDSSDTSIIFSCVKDGNNFIARSTSPEEILSAVQRGFELDNQVTSEEFARAAKAEAAAKAAKAAAAAPAESPDEDRVLRVLIPTTAIVVIVAFLLWKNHKPENDFVVKVKALPAEPAEPSAQKPSSPDGTALQENANDGLAETKVK